MPNETTDHPEQEEEEEEKGNGQFSANHPTIHTGTAGVSGSTTSSSVAAARVPLLGQPPDVDAVVGLVSAPIVGSS